MNSQKTVVVVGGGMAGACAALELADAGVRVELIEQSPFIGGHAVNITCKALDACQHCNGCLVDPKFEALLDHPGINIRRQTKLAASEALNGGFKIKLVTGPSFIDQDKCTNCGLCLETCPEEGALISAPYAADSVRLAIDPDKCLYFRDQVSTLCRDACPEEAIDFSGSPQESELTADALIMASGFEPYDPSAKVRLGYGRIPAVLTALELERMMRDRGRAVRPEDDAPAKKVAFIQCVGSREFKGHNYCSRICCGYALRLARALTHRQGAEVSIFHMDLQTVGEDFDAYLDEARAELNLVRAMPYDVLRGDETGAKVVYQPAPAMEPVAEPFDLVVLSQAMTPGVFEPGLLESLGLEPNEHGFISSGKGVFVAGAATGPMDIREVVASATHASQDALAYLEAVEL